MELKSINMLYLAQKNAEIDSTCSKVKVGSCIETTTGFKIFGANHGVSNCVVNGCRRINLYGENSKIHRLPSDCDSIHSEIDAICEAAKIGVSIAGSTIYVTRYPCEACARAIASAGIKKVVYGRKEEISDYTKEILTAKGIEIEHVKEFEEEDNND